MLYCAAWMLYCAAMQVLGVSGGPGPACVVVMTGAAPVASVAAPAGEAVPNYAGPPSSALMLEVPVATVGTWSTSAAPALFEFRAAAQAAAVVSPVLVAAPAAAQAAAVAPPALVAAQVAAVAPPALMAAPAAAQTHAAAAEAVSAVAVAAATTLAGAQGAAAPVLKAAAAQGPVAETLAGAGCLIGAKRSGPERCAVGAGGGLHPGGLATTQPAGRPAAVVPAAAEDTCSTKVSSPCQEPQLKRHKVLQQLLAAGASVDVDLLTEYGQPTGEVMRLWVVSELGKGMFGTTWGVCKSMASCEAQGGEAAGSSGGSQSTNSTRAVMQDRPPASLLKAEYALKVCHSFHEMAAEYQAGTTAEQHEQLQFQTARKEVTVLKSVHAGDAVLNIIQLHAFGMIRSSSCAGSAAVTGVNRGQDGNKQYCLLLELAAHGSLESWVRPGGIPRGMAPAPAHKLLKHIVNGLQDLHSKSGVIHRDLKCSNAVLSGNVSRPVAKLIDFGVSKVMGTDLGDLGKTWRAGTPWFRPPEMREGCKHDVRVDSYQLGMMLVEIRFGEYLPFLHLTADEDGAGLPLSEEQLEQRLSNLAAELDHPDCPYTKPWQDGRVMLTPAEVEFLKMCLEPDVSRRATMQELSGTLYFKKGPAASHPT